MRSTGQLHVIRSKLAPPPMPDRHTQPPRLQRAIARPTERKRPLVLGRADLERRGEEPHAWAVIAALLRYSRAGPCLVLISRREVRMRLGALPSPAATEVLADDALAFTVEEAERALSRARTGAA